MTEPPSDPTQPLLVVSIDGIAPRHVTRVSMPFLTTLALEGGSCFTATTVSPPVTLPVHTTLFRGVDPATHQLVDNTPRPPATDAPSFLKHVRGAGRSSAAFLNWLPLDAVVERDAVDHRQVIDGGYDPEDDHRSVDAAVGLLRDGRHDLAFVYLAHPDVVGHEFGWDSVEYVESLTTSDALLGRLLDAAGPTASVLVTTDHGGAGHGHAHEVRDVLETFVVIRSPGRVAPGSVWGAATALDIAPTIADLCGVDPDPRWEGATLLGQQVSLVDLLTDTLSAMANESYGERVTMLDHALQTAALAAADDAGDEMVLSCLLHDLGHVMGAAGAWGLPGHAEVGARALQQLLSPAIVEPIRHHVDAKRYRVAIEPGYHDRLSVASQMSLAEQGGPLSADAAEAFGTLPFCTEAVLLRSYDDDGKVEGLTIPSLDHYRQMLIDALEPVRPVDPAWARDACRCPECRDPGNDQHLLDASSLDGWTVIRTDRLAEDELAVTLHHRSGDRHLCRIPRTDMPDIDQQPWTATSGLSLRTDSTSWKGDHQAFIDNLASRGIALMHDCGVSPGTVIEVGNTVGYVRETNYGTLFDVIAEPDPVNLAYTPLGLPAHTDNPYREPCPSVQLLHCLAAASDGGASRFVDGLAVAEQLRHDDPVSFAVLAETDVTFRYHGDGVDLRARRPLIELHDNGRVRAISVNNRSMEPFARDDHRTAAFYEAYRTFVDLLDSDEFGIELTLRPGELVAFDNRRVLHGRRAFRATERRHLQGCYIDIDAIRSSALSSPTSPNQSRQPHPGPAGDDQ